MRHVKFVANTPSSTRTDWRYFAKDQDRGRSYSLVARNAAGAKYSFPLTSLAALLFSVRNRIGTLSRSLPFRVLKTLKCKCGPLEKPVFPETAIHWPATIAWPTFTLIPSFWRWA